MPSAESTLIATFERQARGAGIQVNHRGVREAARNMTAAKVTPLLLADFLQKRYATLTKMQHDSLSRVYRDWMAEHSVELDNEVRV
jgi:hypothetical protein